MRTTELLRRSGMWVETALAGSLPPSVRRVMHIELSMSLAYGVFYASIIPFTPVVLRRLGRQCRHAGGLYISCLRRFLSSPRSASC